MISKYLWHLVINMSIIFQVSLNKKLKNHQFKKKRKGTTLVFFKYLKTIVVRLLFLINRQKFRFLKVLQISIFEISKRCWFSRNGEKLIIQIFTLSWNFWKNNTFFNFSLKHIQKKRCHFYFLSWKSTPFWVFKNWHLELGKKPEFLTIY